MKNEVYIISNCLDMQETLAVKTSEEQVFTTFLKVVS